MWVSIPHSISRDLQSNQAKHEIALSTAAFHSCSGSMKESGEWRENPSRPRVCVKSLDSKRAFMGFARPMAGTTGSASAFRGNFLDLRTLAYALSGTSHSLATACKAFGTAHGKLAVAEHGTITAEYIDYNCANVLATQEFFEKAHITFDQLGLSIPPTRAYSPASIAKASLRDMGVRPFRESAHDFGHRAGRAMSGLFSGVVRSAAYARPRASCYC